MVGVLAITALKHLKEDSDLKQVLPLKLVGTD